jgi:hypothetical protein
MAVPPSPASQFRYFEGFLEKKEKKWIRYWVVLIGSHLCFFKDQQTERSGQVRIGVSYDNVVECHL